MLVPKVLALTYINLVSNMNVNVNSKYLESDITFTDETGD